MKHQQNNTDTDNLKYFERCNRNFGKAENRYTSFLAKLHDRSSKFNKQTSVGSS